MPQKEGQHTCSWFPPFCSIEHECFHFTATAFTLILPSIAAPCSQGPEGTPSPDCPLAALWGSPTCPGPGPHMSPGLPAPSPVRPLQTQAPAPHGPALPGHRPCPAMGLASRAHEPNPTLVHNRRGEENLSSSFLTATVVYEAYPLASEGFPATARE